MVEHEVVIFSPNWWKTRDFQSSRSAGKRSCTGLSTVSCG